MSDIKDDIDKKMEEIGKSIDISWRGDLLKFFLNYVEEKEANKIIDSVLAYKISNIPRKMIDAISRFISLAEEQKRDSLKILFIVICIEALYKLRFPNNKKQKKEIVIDFFKNDVIEKDKKYILDNVKVEVSSLSDSDELDIMVFANLINDIRNKVVHEGNYWGFSFPSDNTDVWLMQFVELGNPKETENSEKIFYLRLSYNDFKKICVRAMIKNLLLYFDEHVDEIL